MVQLAVTLALGAKCISSNLIRVTKRYQKLKMTLNYKEIGQFIKNKSDMNVNNFCSQSCSAIYNNKNRNNGK